MLNLSLSEIKLKKKIFSKSFFHFIKEYRLLILMLLIPFVIVNSFSYEKDSIIINPSNLLNIFTFSNTIVTEGLSTFVSIITVVTLVLAFLQWQKNEKFQRIADVNGLLEELRYNINVLGGLFFTMDEKKFYTKLNFILKNLNKTLTYPNPSDSDEIKIYFFKLIDIKKYDEEFTSTGFQLVKLRNDFITSAISSKSYFNLEKSRIFMNLSHLNYSLMRYNIGIDAFNTKKINFNKLQQEYIIWLHFRLHFMLIDLINQVSEFDFIDKEFIIKIKNYYI